ncbi:MAG: hypothetical protein QOH29_100 [Actinomycetota bacterium]|nr:hypothetical protein [Actinomycetota bacterium]
MLMQYVAAGFGLAALILFGRWLLVRQSRDQAAFPAIGVSSCMVLAVAASFPIVDRATLEGRLSHAASTLIGIHVRVTCQTLTGSAVDMGRELGFVKWGADGVPEHKTLIKHDQCNDLSAYLDSSKEHPSAAQVLAVHVLSHESMHMSGTTTEAVAECHAMQHDAALAVDLGASPSAAHALAVRYWQTVYPNMADNYRSNDCGPGAGLDLHLPDAPWSPDSFPSPISP